VWEGLCDPARHAVQAGLTCLLYLGFELDVYDARYLNFRGTRRNLCDPARHAACGSGADINSLCSHALCGHALCGHAREHSVALGGLPHCPLGPP
jgi:hypothetical protein